MDFDEIDIPTQNPIDVSIKNEPDELLSDVPMFIETEPEVYEFDLSKYLPNPESFCDDEVVKSNHFTEEEDLWRTHDEPVFTTPSEFEVEEVSLQSYIKIETEELVPEWGNYWEEQVPTTSPDLHDQPSYPEITPCRVLLDPTAVARYFARRKLIEEKQLEDKPKGGASCQGGIAELVKLRRTKRRTSKVDDQISESEEGTSKDSPSLKKQNTFVKSFRSKRINTPSLKSCQSVIKKRKIQENTCANSKNVNPIPAVKSRRRWHMKRKRSRSTKTQVLSSGSKSNSIIELDNIVEPNTPNTLDSIGKSKKLKISNVKNVSELRTRELITPFHKNKDNCESKQILTYENKISKQRKINVPIDSQQSSLDTTDCSSKLQDSSSMTLITISEKAAYESVQAFVPSVSSNVSRKRPLYTIIESTCDDNQTDEKPADVNSISTCLYCKMHFKDIETLFKHVTMEHTDDVDKDGYQDTSQLHPCLYCTMSFHRQHDLINHVIRKHINLSVKTADSTSVKEHVISAKPAPFQCKYCPLKYQYENALSKHIKKEHKVFNNETVSAAVEKGVKLVYTSKQYHCKFCPLSYYFKHSLEYHVNKKHKNIKKKEKIENVKKIRTLHPRHIVTNLEQSISSTHEKTGSWLICNSCLKSYKVHTKLSLKSWKKCPRVVYTCRSCIEKRANSSEINIMSSFTANNKTDEENVSNSKTTSKLNLGSMRENVNTENDNENTQDEPNRPILYFNFKCLTCDTYHDERTIIHHFNAIHKASFHCVPCKAMFKTTHELAKHIESLHEKNSCIYCNEKFTDGNLYAHIYIDHKCKLNQMVEDVSVDNRKNVVYFSFDLSLTKKFTDSEEKLEIAPLPNDELYNFQCSQCFSTFTSVSSLKTHIILNHKMFDIMDHICLTCEQQFKKKEHLSVHINYFKHHCISEEKYQVTQCEFCDFVCIDKEYAKKHYVLCHGKGALSIISVCIYCQNYFRSEDALKIHIDDVHSCKRSKLTVNDPSDKVKEKKIKAHKKSCICNQCSNVTQEKCSYDTEIETAVELSNNTRKDIIDISDVSCSIVKNNPYEICYQCNFCLAMFKTELHILKHIKFIHKLVINYVKCFTCNLILKSPKNLFFHTELKHDAAKKCLYCQHYYQNHDQLCEHFKEAHPVDVSNGITGYPCEYCKSNKVDIKFISIKHLNIHISIKHKCNICKRIYRYINDLEEHKTSKHDNSEINSLFSLIMVKNEDGKSTYVETIESEKMKKNVLQCTYCELHFSTEFELNEHKIDIHEVKNCIICNNGYSCGIAVPENCSLRCSSCQYINITLNQDLASQVNSSDFAITDDTDVSVNTQFNLSDPIIININENDIGIENLNKLFSDTVFEIEIPNFGNEQVICSELHQNSSKIIIVDEQNDLATQNISDLSCKEVLTTDEKYASDLDINNTMIYGNNKIHNSALKTENTAVIEKISGLTQNCANIFLPDDSESNETENILTITPVVNIVIPDDSVANELESGMTIVLETNYVNIVMPDDSESNEIDSGMTIVTKTNAVNIEMPDNSVSNEIDNGMTIVAEIDDSVQGSNETENGTSMAPETSDVNFVLPNDSVQVSNEIENDVTIAPEANAVNILPNDSVQVSNEVENGMTIAPETNIVLPNDSTQVSNVIENGVNIAPEANAVNILPNDSVQVSNEVENSMTIVTETNAVNVVMPDGPVSNEIENSMTVDTETNAVNILPDDSVQVSNEIENYMTIAPEANAVNILPNDSVQVSNEVENGMAIATETNAVNIVMPDGPVSNKIENSMDIVAETNAANLLPDNDVQVSKERENEIAITPETNAVNIVMPDDSVPSEIEKDVTEAPETPETNDVTLITPNSNSVASEKESNANSVPQSYCMLS